MALGTGGTYGSGGSSSSNARRQQSPLEELELEATLTKATSELSGSLSLRAKKLKLDNLWRLVAACCLGTLIEWQDYFLFANFATAPKIIGNFFDASSDREALFTWLSIYLIGFLFRPIGALLFGYIGDKYGRKGALTWTILIMGLGSFFIGCLPIRSQLPAAYSNVPGYLLIFFRIGQGISIGGEVGGAIIYIGEACPANQRGYYTSFLQTTASLGLVLSTVIILIVKFCMPIDSYNTWGWRIPFFCSALLVLVSLYIRTQIEETVTFQRLKMESLKARGTESLVKDTPSYFSLMSNKKTLYFILLTFVGVCCGQSALWYSSQFLVLTYMEQNLKMNPDHATLALCIAVVMAAPWFVFFGSVSDQMGRKTIMLLGIGLGTIFYFPIYMGITAFGPYLINDVNPDSLAPLVSNPNYSVVFITCFIWLAVMILAALYGPLPAFLIELFPTRIRYSSISLPYQLGSGIIGGLVPIIGELLIEKTQSLNGILIFPICVSFISGTIMYFFIEETLGTDLENMAF